MAGRSGTPRSDEDRPVGCFPPAGKRFIKQNSTVKRQRTPEVKTGEAEEHAWRGDARESRREAQGTALAGETGRPGARLPACSATHAPVSHPGALPHRGAGSTGLNKARVLRGEASRSLCYATVTPQEPPVVFLRLTRFCEGPPGAGVPQNALWEAPWWPVMGDVGDMLTGKREQSRGPGFTDLRSSLVCFVL